MIGGTDIYVEIPAGAPAVDFAVRTIRLFWPAAVFENADSPEPARNYEDLDFSNLTEVMAYRDTESAEKWEALGAVPELDGTMIHLKLGDSYLTIVVDDRPSDAIQKIVDTIAASLKKAQRTINLREAA